MAITVAYYEVSDWYVTTTSNNVTGVSWASGDVIVIAQYVSNDDSTITAPTNANLTFTARQTTTASINEAVVKISTAVAGSAQSSQTITSGRGGTTNANGAAVWVLTGADAYRGGFANNAESATSYTPLAGSVVCFLLCDWTATAGTRTGTTGSGTLTDREDSVNATWGGVWGGEWLGTTNASNTYGISSYTGMRVAQSAVEITASSSTSATATPTDVRDTASGAGGRYTLSLTATAFDDDRIDLAWNTVSGASGYDIERDDVVVVTDHATTSYTDTGLSPGVEYCYRVRAVL